MGACDNVPFPLYKTNKMEIDEMPEWVEITEIKFSGGGAFIMADRSI